MATTKRRFSPCVPFLLFSILFVLLIPASLVQAQEFRATITGVVTDPRGAAVPGATVTVINVNTNVSLSTVSNEVGNYTVPNINFPRHLQLGLRVLF